MKKKGLIIGIIVLLVIALGVGSYFMLFNKDEKPKEKEKINEVIKTHIAYIKINPSIKIEYTEKCINDVCEEPVVTTYELINDDAKSMFKDVNLLDGDKTLAAVMEKICETAKDNGVEFTNVEVYSDWEDFNTYMNENKEETDTWNYNVSKTETNQIETIIEEKEKVNTNNTEITTDDQTNDNANTKTNTGTSTTTNTNTNTSTNTKTNTKSKDTISLSDNVTYTIGGEGYCCDKCFSDALINEISNAKGYYTVKADSSTIDFRKISLSSPYNTATYVASNLKDKLIAAGGENCSGLGGDTGTLTKELCNQFHLKCE